jgi:hypothetical protein
MCGCNEFGGLEGQGQAGHTPGSVVAGAGDCATGWVSDPREEDAALLAVAQAGRAFSALPNPHLWISAGVSSGQARSKLTLEGRRRLQELERDNPRLVQESLTRLQALVDAEILARDQLRRAKPHDITIGGPFSDNELPLRHAISEVRVVPAIAGESSVLFEFRGHSYRAFLRGRLFEAKFGSDPEWDKVFAVWALADSLAEPAPQYEKRLGHARTVVTVREHLSSKGWTALDPKYGSAVAQRVFQTAVGEVKAHVWLRHTRECFGYVISGEYWSEGQNVLEAFSRLFWDSGNAERIKAEVESFELKAVRQIEGTYAMRLARLV